MNCWIWLMKKSAGYQMSNPSLWKTQLGLLSPHITNSTLHKYEVLKTELWHGRSREDMICDFLVHFISISHHAIFNNRPNCLVLI